MSGRDPGDDSDGDHVKTPPDSEPQEAISASELLSSETERAHNHRRRGESEKAREVYLGCLPLARAQLDIQKELEILVALGAVYVRLNLSKEAKSHFETALRVSRETTDPRYEAMSLNSLAQIAMGENDPAGAVVLFEKALGIRQGMSDARSAARTFLDMSRALIQLERKEEAVKHLNQAESTFRQLGDLREESSVLRVLGNLHTTERHFGLAVQCFQRSLSIEQRRGDDLRQGAALKGFGELFLAFDKLSQSWKYLDRALESFRAAKHRSLAIETMKLMIEVKTRMKENEDGSQGSDAGSVQDPSPFAADVGAEGVVVSQPSSSDVSRVADTPKEDSPVAASSAGVAEKATDYLAVGVQEPETPPEEAEDVSRGDARSCCEAVRGALEKKTKELELLRLKFDSERRRLLNQIAALEAQLRSKDELIDQLLK